MDSAAGSPASSSDLYSSSDPENPPSYLLSRNGFKSRAEVPSGMQHEPVDSNGSEVAGPIPVDGIISLQRSSLENPLSGPNGQNKRKREQDTDYPRPDSNRSSPNGPETLQDGPTCEVASGNDTSKPSPSGRKLFRGENPIGKRAKLDEHATGNGRVIETKEELQSGRSKVDSLPLLPPEILQHIFSFVPPVFLGRLLRVSRTFHKYLTSDISDQTGTEGERSGPLERMKADAIWASSRKRFCPSLPKPLRGLKELDMWRLLRGQDCQLCREKKMSISPLDSPNPWLAGPGENSVRVIWPFGVRCCGKCLEQSSEKELTLLLSSSCPSFLLPALPFAFVSQSKNFVASIAIKNTPQPPELQLVKYYYKFHLEEVKARFENARELGPGAAEEWIKGLEREGRERIDDAARWEHYEAKGGLKKINSRPNPKNAAPLSSLSHESVDASPGADVSSNRSAPYGLIYGGNQPGDNSPSISNGSKNSPQIVQAFPLALPHSQLSVAPSHEPLPPRPHGLFQQPRHERSLRDVNEAKATRRAEIERRCLALDPPLQPNVLNYMESFQAAIQISSALTDQAWEVLKPRLLAQRDHAERRESERVNQSRILQAKTEERRQQEIQQKEAKEKEWEVIQTPIRNRLAKYADEIIQSSWFGGKHVTKESSPKFAADVLLYARQRFYEIPDREKVTDFATSGLGRDTSQGITSTKLILENMKWLFDNKIKPLTEHFQKELFLCNGCEGNFKFYGFEGVIQHYAAKHTTVLSLGSIVVHWRAEWPEHPPFHPSPSTAKAAYYAIPLPSSTVIPGQHSRAPITSSYPGFGQMSTAGSQIASLGYDGPQFPSSPYQVPYSTQQYPQPPVPVHYNHPSNYPLHTQMLHPNSQFVPGPPGPSTGPNSGLNAYDMYPAEHPSQMSQAYGPQLHDRTYPPFVQGHERDHRDYAPTFPTVPPRGPYPQSMYEVQMNEMAKHAREIWFGTSGIKDLPGSVRIWVVIHHVVARHEKKYTNEPNLSMFIDGLDHNSQMRPVRSLNGLACKTCVTSGNGPGAAYHTHPQSVADRKLYTLPHLLNHFKSMHMEKPRPSVVLSSGFDTSKLDWKRDMVELPETSIIADLVHASGMDDTKLSLIAWAFPGVFPFPLPRIGSGGNIGPTPKLREEPPNHLEPVQLNRIATSEVYQTPPHRSGSRADDLGLYSGTRPATRATARSSEPPGEDEYDPHRPAYLGKIVQPHEAGHHAWESRRQSPIRPEPHHVNPTIGETYPQSSSGYRGHPRPYRSDAIVRLNREGDVAQSYHVRSHTNEQPVTPTRDALVSEGRFGGQHSGELINTAPTRQTSQRHVSEDGELVEEPSKQKPESRMTSPVEDVTAAEKFLNEFEPSVDPNQYVRKVPLDIDVEASSLATQIRDRQKHFDHEHGYVANGLRAPEADGLNRERIVRNTPEPVETIKRKGDENAAPFQRTSSQVHYNDIEISSSRTHLPITRASAERRNLGAYSDHDTSTVVPPGDSHGMHERRAVFRSGEGPHVIHYRARSRSPRAVPLEAEYYRSRSPVSSSRHESMYRIPSPALLRDGRSQRLVNYEYTPMRDHYNSTPARGYPEDRYQRRVEYVSVGADDYGGMDAGHYYVAQNVGQGPPSEHSRIERGYSGDHVYERDGRLYYTDPRVVETRPLRGSLPVYHDYEYHDNTG